MTPTRMSGNFFPSDYETFLTSGSSQSKAWSPGERIFKMEPQQRIRMPA